MRERRHGGGWRECPPGEDVICRAWYWRGPDRVPQQCQEILLFVGDGIGVLVRRWKPSEPKHAQATVHRCPRCGARWQVRQFLARRQEDPPTPAAAPARTG